MGYGPDAASKWGQLSAEYRAVLPGYFETLRAHLVAGRLFGPEDSTYSVHRAIVDDRLAKTAWPGQNPIGQKLAVPADFDGNSYVLAEVVGVVQQIHQRQLRGEEPQQVFVPYGARDDLMYGPQQLTFVVRTSMGPVDFETLIRHAVTASGIHRPAYTFRTLEGNVAEATSDVRFAVRVMLAFAVLALLLTVIGIYGAVSYIVEQRRYEFGIRIALGAQPPQVVRLVVRQGLLLAGAGAVLGIAASLASLRALDSLLFGVRAIDAPTLLTVALLLCGAAAAASAVPAFRTVSLDPAKTIRGD